MGRDRHQVLDTEKIGQEQTYAFTSAVDTSTWTTYRFSGYGRGVIPATNFPCLQERSDITYVNGNRVFAALAIPVVIALTSLAFDRLKITAAIAMSAFVVIAGFSIGLFYLPSAVLLIWPERRLSD